MSKKIFTEKEIKILSGNPHVKSVSSKVRMGNYQDKYFKKMVLKLKLLGWLVLSHQGRDGVLHIGTTE